LGRQPPDHGNASDDFYRLVKEWSIFFKTPKPQNGIDTLIGTGTRIEGDIFFNGALWLDGTVRGSVYALPTQPSKLVISKKGHIKGEVQAAHLVVSGVIDGQVKGAEVLQLQPDARVTGEVHYTSIEIQRGAIVRGQLVHTTSAVPKAVSFKLASDR